MAFSYSTNDREENSWLFCIPEETEKDSSSLLTADKVCHRGEYRNSLPCKNMLPHKQRNDSAESLDDEIEDLLKMGKFMSRLPFPYSSAHQNSLVDKPTASVVPRDFRARRYLPFSRVKS